MMEPDAMEPAGTRPPHRPAPGLGSQTAGPDGSSQAGAPLRWPYTSRRAQELAQQSSTALHEDDETSESDNESDDESSHSSDRREHVDEADADSGQSSNDASSAVLDGHRHTHGEPLTEPETTVTAESIAARHSKMFVIGAAAAVASELPRLAPKATKAIVWLAAAHMDGMTKADVEALSSSFGNFDRTVGLGWLCGDAVGLPLMERKAAHASGLKAARAAGKIKGDLRAAKLKAQRAAFKLAVDDPQRAALQKQAIEDEAALLCETIDVALPEASHAAPPQRASATGSRKRAREAEPSHDELVASAVDCMLKAEKEVTRAGLRAGKADQLVEDTLEKWERIGAKYNGADDATLEQLQRNERESYAAEGRHVDALLAAKDAEVAVLEATLDERDADSALVNLEWGEAVRSLDSLTEAHAKLARQYRDLVAEFRGGGGMGARPAELDQHGRRGSNV
jgi:hypothetical protein